MLKLLAVLILVNICSTDCAKSDRILQRTKRFLIFPQSGLFKIVIGIAYPINLGLGRQITISLNFQFQYNDPTNITQLQQYPPTISRSRENREKPNLSDRTLAYMATEDMLDRYGINGRACLLRSICENAENSVYHKANGIYGHLLHIFLAPDYGDGQYDDGLDQDYIDAQKAGYYGVECSTLYADCPYGYGMFDVISVFD